MCGITGFLDLSRQTPEAQLKAVVIKMADTILHRGPDDAGTWQDEITGVALGFRRLAILDLSPTGHQPMISSDNRYVIVYNGEVYNFAELRADLEKLGHSFRGTSDTEVMLTAFCQWGLLTAVKRFNGMFGIALWDRHERALHLIRDRLGIKPLYYGWMGNYFLFGSELKAIREHPAFKAEIDRNALTLFLRHNYIPTPHSIYQGINKLPPGTILSLPLEHANNVEPIPYWSGRETVEEGVRQPFQGNDNEAVDELENILRHSVRLRMIADVPLGAFLSGGVDSSTVVSLMQAQSSQPIKTFTIGFWEKEYDEARFAKAIAAHLGTDHTELYVTPKQALDVIPRLPYIYDEPFSDSSQIPTLLISQLARQKVTVSLSGDGGDELFAGYDRYYHFRDLWNKRKRIPSWMSGVLRNMISPFVHRSDISNSITIKLNHLQDILALDSPTKIYHHMLSHWHNPVDVTLGGMEPLTTITDRTRWAEIPNFQQQMMYLDLVTYLPDDILVKVDRASMAVSLEARVPLLDDHRVVEFAWSLPHHLKVRGDVSKWALRQVLYRYVPRELIERPKMGFGIPIDSWLREPLRPWAEALLDERRLRNEDYFDPQPIRKVWKEHLEGKANWQYLIWDILMFQSWLEVTSR